MTVAYLKNDFAGGLYPEDGGPGWEIEGELYPTNPRYDLPRYTGAMMLIFQACTDDEGTLRLLPDVGGLYDQAAIMVDALGYMSFTHREIVAYLRERTK